MTGFHEVFRCHVTETVCVVISANGSIGPNRYDRLANLLHQQALVLEDERKSIRTAYNPPALEDASQSDHALRRSLDATEKALREARHDLANEQQKVAGLDAALKRQTERSAQIAAELTETQGEKARKDETNRQLLRRIDELLAEVETLRAENHALKQAPVPANDAAMISLEHAMAEGSEHVPVDDEAEDMGGSESDAAEVAAEPPPRVHRLPVTMPHAPRQPIEIGPGVTVMLPGSGHKVASALMDGNGTWRGIIATGVASTEGSAMAAISKLRAEIQKQTGKAWTVLSVDGAYRILPVETPAPDNPPASQDEGAAGASPEEGGAVSEGRGTGDHDVPSQAPQFVAPPVTGEGATTPVEPAPVADGELLSVDIKTRFVRSSVGSYRVDGSPLAKALHLLRKGDMFGLDRIAVVAGWRNGETARTALSFERPRLALHGLDLYVDRFNARLRRTEA